jgi:hypothetical protein
MTLYQWANTLTGETIDTLSYDEAPEGEGWRRVYSFGVGKIIGAGSTPARPSTGYKKNG